MKRVEKVRERNKERAALICRVVNAKDIRELGECQLLLAEQRKRMLREINEVRQETFEVAIYEHIAGLIGAQIALSQFLYQEEG